MELRRFGRYKKRTWYVHKSLMKQDYLVIVSAILLLGISIGLIFLNHGRFYNPWGMIFLAFSKSMLLSTTKNVPVLSR